MALGATWRLDKWTLLVFYGIVLPFSFFNPSPKSTIEVPNFSAMVGYKYLLLSYSAACWTSQETAMTESHL